MADLPSEDHIKLLKWEIYDETRHPGDGLIWLSPDEETPTLAQTAESFETTALDPSVVYGPEAIDADRPAQDPNGILGSVLLPSSNTDVPLLRPINSAGDGSAGILFSSLLPSRRTFWEFSLTRRFVRVAGLVSTLLIGSVLPSILGHLRTTKVKASAAVGGRLTESGGQPMSRPVRVLTVMAGRQETLKDISIRYVGHFDDALFEEIRKHNPELKDPDHLEDGQLIRIPLRARTSIK